MTDAPTKGSARLSLVPPQPLAFAGPRDPSSRGVAGDDAWAADRDATVVRPVRPVDLVRSTDPVEVLTSLGDKLALMGYECQIQLIQDRQPARRISRPVEAEHEASTAELTALLLAEPLVLCDGRVVAVGFRGDGGSSGAHGAGESRQIQGGDEPTRHGATGSFHGAVVARRRRGGPVSAADAEVVHGLVDHAVNVVVGQRLREQLESQRTRARNLEQALDTNRAVGVAIGIVMAGQRCSAADAFALLRGASQSGNRKLRDVAAQVAYTGELPAPGELAAPGELSGR